MERWRGRVALVTGASAGIGYNVAKALAERGMKVVACARNTQAIQKLSEEVKGQAGTVTAIKCDVSKQEEVAAMFHAIRQDSALGRVDVCINNAGLAHDAPILTGDPARWKHMFDVNVLGLMMVTRESFQLMQENNIDDGHIILVNSLSGIEVVNYKPWHCYCATKFAVNAIRQGIRQELREIKSNIRISQVCPGAVHTRLQSTVLGKEVAEAYGNAYKAMEPEDITNTILYIMDAPPHVEINDVIMRPTEAAE